MNCSAVQTNRGGEEYITWLTKIIIFYMLIAFHEKFLAFELSAKFQSDGSWWVIFGIGWIKFQ